MNLNKLKDLMSNLLQFSSSEKKPPLYQAVENQDTELVKKMLENISKKDLNMLYEPRITDYDAIFDTPKTAFMKACVNGNKEIIDLFLEKKDLNINMSSYSYESAFMSALRYAPLEIVEKLMNLEGISFKAKHPLDDNALMVLAQRNKQDNHEQIANIAKILINSGVNYHQTQLDSRKNAFDLAIEYANEAMLDVLLLTDINQQNKNSLMKAVESDIKYGTHVTQKLLNHGFDYKELKPHMQRLKKENPNSLNTLKEINDLIQIYEEHNHLSMPNKINSLRIATQKTVDNKKPFKI